MPKVTIDTEKARAQKRFDYVAGMLSEASGSRG